MCSKLAFAYIIKVTQAQPFFLTPIRNEFIPIHFTGIAYLLTPNHILIIISMVMRLPLNCLSHPEIFEILPLIMLAVAILIPNSIILALSISSNGLGMGVFMHDKNGKHEYIYPLFHTHIYMYTVLQMIPS